jgi:NADH-quinone oxidoreductase subunit H
MQGETLLTIGGIAIPKYGFLIQPLGFLLLITALYAETNRLPFDLPEGESEIVAGYHLEYGSMKFSLFMLAEYINMFVASALITTLFFGGWQPLPGLLEMANKGAEILGLSGIALEWVRIAIEMGSFFIKVSFFLWLFVWVRWTIPRFRFDQVMTLGWKVMLPLALINIFVTGILIAMGVL